MIFDYSDGGFIMPTGSNMGVDCNGDLHMRAGPHCSMDMKTGNLHFTSFWKENDDINPHANFDNDNFWE